MPPAIRNPTRPVSSPVGIVLTACLLAIGASPVTGRAAVDTSLFGLIDRDGDGQITPAEVSTDHRRLFDRLLRTSDGDGDGRLDAAEFASGLTPTRPAKPFVEVNTEIEERRDTVVWLILLKLDTDRDTRLTRGEAPAELREAHDRLVAEFDRNKDGELDRGELSRPGPRLARRAGQIARAQGWDIEKELRRLETEQGGAADRFDRPFQPMRDLADPRRAAEVYKRLDANGDGRLVVDELPGPLAERIGPLLRRADKDRDQAVSQREFLAASEKLAAYLARQEAPAPAADAPTMMKPGPEQGGAEQGGAGTPPPARRKLRRLLARQDANGDGVLQRGEAQGRLAKRFDRADKNGDGRLGPAELAEIVDAMQ